MDQKKKLFLWKDLHWDIQSDEMFGVFSAIALCPKQRCNCKLVKQHGPYSRGEYKYECIRCDFKIILAKDITELGKDVLGVLESYEYQDAEIVNIDGDLIRVFREEKNDDNYWVDVKISKNKKNEVQLMVLAGNKENKDKTQLFFDPNIEKISFDQNNDHPSDVFVKVVGIFKNSKSEISSS